MPVVANEIKINQVRGKPVFAKQGLSDPPPLYSLFNLIFEG
jgi:hypothetical protein